MAIVVAVIGAATAAIGVVGVATPATLARLAATVWGTQRGTYLAVAARLTFGIVFVLAAPATRFPSIVLAIGIISIVSAVTILILGTGRMRAFVEWFASRSHVFVRAWALLAAAFGVFLVYAGI